MKDNFQFPELELKQWFQTFKRSFPWREDPTPYQVWISEVMLQQTQAQVVIPYFKKWMEKFPTIQDLSEAPLDDVLKAWEGLGYYSRARNLHEGAKWVMQQFQGRLPSEKDDLKSIKGLGDYTVGAILSFAFKKKATAVDGNVMRVLTRYFEIEEDLTKSSTQKKVRTLAEKIVPDTESWVFNEGLIELGATLCIRNPLCSECPLKGSCLALKNGKTQKLPFKSKKYTITKLFRAVPVIISSDNLLVIRGKKGHIMQGLYEFPYVETNLSGWKKLQVQNHFEHQWNMKLKFLRELDVVYHSFTRFEVSLTPCLFTSQKQLDIPDHEWISYSHLKNKALSSGHLRILNQLEGDFS